MVPMLLSVFKSFDKVIRQIRDKWVENYQLDINPFFNLIDSDDNIAKQSNDSARSLCILAHFEKQQGKMGLITRVKTRP